MSIKGVEDPPQWHLEICHSTALIFQMVRSLSLPSLKTPIFKGMSKIIRAPYRGEDLLNFYQTDVLMKCNSVQHKLESVKYTHRGKKNVVHPVTSACMSHAQHVLLNNFTLNVERNSSSHMSRIEKVNFAVFLLNYIWQVKPIGLLCNSNHNHYSCFKIALA